MEQFFLTVGQNNFGNKIPFLICRQKNQKINDIEVDVKSMGHPVKSVSKER